MNIITISREFGSGGRELGKRLAELLNYDYYDSEIIYAIARNRGLDSEYVNTILNEQGWQGYPITYRCTIGSANYVQSNKVEMLLEQKRVIEQIAALNKDFIIVGRNADIILQQYNAFNIFVCAELSSKVKRCMERASKKENLSEKELIRKIRHIDKCRSKTREILTDSPWGDKSAYHLIVNSTDWEIKELASAVSGFAKKFFGRSR